MVRGENNGHRKGFNVDFDEGWNVSDGERGLTWVGQAGASSPNYVGTWLMS